MGGFTHMRTRLLGPLAVVFCAAVILPAVAVSETPTIEARATNTWKPPSVTITAGGELKLVNLAMGTHGVEWKSGPEKPSCSATVPVGTTPAASGANWEGTCSFAKAGSYEFWCTVHGSSMKAVVTVNGAGPAPSVKKLSPKKGRAGAITTVTITGTHFTGATAVTFGATAGTGVTVNSDTSITAKSPPESAGTVDVRVTGPGGTSAVSKGDRFKFVKHK
jgi:plastocyanin